MNGNGRISAVFREIADLLDIKGENAFRIRSYRMGADSIEAHGQDVAGMVARGEALKSIDGVGDGIAAKIREIVETGDCDYHRKLLDEVPAGLLDLLEIPGLGPKGVSLVWRKLGVTSAADLEAAIADGRFRTLPGMKEKKEARIRKGLEERLRRQGRFLLSDADRAATELIRYLRERGAERVEPAGSFRRRKETVGDLDLIVVGGESKDLSDALATHADVKEVLGHGDAKTSVVLTSGLQIDLRPFAAESLGAAMQYFTGSKAHNVALRERAVKRGLKLNEYGVFQSDGTRVAGATESDVYVALGLALVPPELREDHGEIQAAEANALPRLVERSDLRGDLHSHTTESDGRDTLEAMVDAARRQGLTYLAVTDHSRAIPSPTNGTGMDERRCLAHIARIRDLQKRTEDFTILAGIEVDILPDGRLDMDDDVLGQLDVVVASLHSRLNMESAEMTERMLHALENPHFHIWGHPLARLILKREPVALDVETVLSEAARLGVALEVNGQPDRLDLPDSWIRTAREKGARFAVSSDSHATGQFENLAYGVGQARRGWLTAADVLNTLDATALRSALRRPAVVRD